MTLILVVRLSSEYKLAFPPFSSGCSPQSAMAYFKSGYGVRGNIGIIGIIGIIILTVVILISGERASPPNDNDGRGELASLNGLPH